MTTSLTPVHDVPTVRVRAQSLRVGDQVRSMGTPWAVLTVDHRSVVLGDGVSTQVLDTSTDRPVTVYLGDPDGCVCNGVTVCPDSRFVARRHGLTIALVCPGGRVKVEWTDDGPMTLAAPEHGPEDSPILRSLMVPAGYVPPTSDVAGTMAAARAATGDRASIEVLAAEVIRVGGFGPEDRPFLLGVARYVDDTWPADYWTAHVWAIAARLVVGQR